MGRKIKSEFSVYSVIHKFCVAKLFYDQNLLTAFYAFNIFISYCWRKNFETFSFSSVSHCLMVFPAVSMTMRLVCHA